MKGLDGLTPLIYAIRSKKTEAVRLIGEYTGTDFKLFNPLEEAEIINVPDIINYNQSKMNASN